MLRTRIKICGLTRAEDVLAAVAAGADAIGFVFYPPSPRFVTVAQARTLARLVPPFVSIVGLFVNANPHEVHTVLRNVPLQILQFHGDETPEACSGFGRMWIKAARMTKDTDLVEFNSCYAGAGAILLDTYAEGFGGTGRSFDWCWISPDLDRDRLILSGGLTPENVCDAVTRIRPWAVDVSSGVESVKGIKDARKIQAFILGVKKADAGNCLSST